MKEVITVYEENHGLVCIAANYRAAAVNLVEQNWITKETEFYDEKTHQSWQPLTFFMGTDNPTEDEMAAFIEQKMKDDDYAFFDGTFYISATPVAERTMCSAEVVIRTYNAETGAEEIYGKHFDTLEGAFRFAAKLEAFSDCTDESLKYITSGGMVYYYAGWRPGMEITFIDADGEEVWSRRYPEWDH